MTPVLVICDAASHARGKVAKLRTYLVDLESDMVLMAGNQGRDQTRLSGVDVIPVEDQRNTTLMAREKGRGAVPAQG